MRPVPTAKKDAPQIRALTGARAIPVLLIVLFHYHEWFGHAGRPWYDAVVSKGYIWVEFFFALSGFLLFYVYGPRFGERLSAPAIGAFLAARVSRLYPLQLVTLLAAAVAEGDRRISQSQLTGVSFWNVPAFEGKTWETFVSNLLLIQAWNIHDVMSWNPVAWFVSVELFLYLVCPALMLLAGARFGWRTMAIGAAGSTLLVALATTSGAGIDLTAHNGIWRGLADFSIGVFLGGLFIACRGKEWTLPTSVHTLAQIGALTAVVTGFYLTGPPRTARDLVVAGPMFALIFVLASDRGLVASALHARWLLKLGEWAFAIYMVQYAVMVALPVRGPAAAPWIQGMLAISGSIVAGGLAWRFIERPLAEVMRRRLLTACGLPGGDR